MAHELGEDAMNGMKKGLAVKLEIINKPSQKLSVNMKNKTLISQCC